ncbi:MAG TPA: hypothetical protein VNW54_01890 [Granulicella sp.]|jgi:hypothetical protein|nr:hypothetical protein [Granulicella sp.]
MANKLTQRFAELEAQLKQVKATKISEYSSLLNRNLFQVDSTRKLAWEVKARHLLEKACGLESQHFKHFEKAARPDSVSTSADILERMGTVFLAAKEDFEGGYLSSVRSLVQSEVFGSELEQATELLSSGYKSPAAVVAGIVLETALRELCTQHGVPHGKLDKMNADLVKQSVYNAIMAKRITALAAIRNSAAHGKPDEFNEGDVKSMIDDVERFLSQHLG